MPSAIQIERRRRRTVEDVIFVDATLAVSARVEGVGNDLDIFDRNIVGSQRIERAPNPMRAVFLFGEKIGHLAERMDA